MLCRIRDGINYLGPGVKHRDDKKGTRGPGHWDDRFFPYVSFLSSSRRRPGSIAPQVFVSLRDKFYDLGPVVKPRDDKKREPYSAGAGSRDESEYVKTSASAV